MTIICPTCQAPNEETHQFCATCGTKLTHPVVAQPPTSAVPAPGPPAPAAIRPPAPPAAVPPPVAAVQPAPEGAPLPPAASAPPAAPAAAWSSTPSPAGPPRGSLAQPVRLSAKVIIGGVIAALILAGAAGLAIGAVLNSKTPSDHAPVVIPTVSPSAGPVVTPGPGVTPGPIVTGAPTSSPATGAGSPETTQTIDVNTISVTVPADWKKGTTSNTSIPVYRPNGGGMLGLLSGRLQSPTTPDAILQEILTALGKSEQDVTVCNPAKDFPVPSGPAGRLETFCYTHKTASGQSLKVVDLYIVGVDQNVLYEVNIYATEDTFKEAVEDFAKRALGSVKWKLYQAP
jgi:hypothetical protein